MPIGSTRKAAYIQGAAMASSWQDGTKSLSELIFGVVTAALHDSGIAIAAADSVVIASHDVIDGRSLSSMVTAPAAGAYMRDEIRLSDDGLAAFSLAAARIEAGESEVSIVAAWGRASEGGWPYMSRTSMDPFTQQPLGLGDMDISAFRLSRWLARHGGLARHGDRDDGRHAAVAARRRRAEANPRGLAGATTELPVSHPLHSGEGPKWADVVAAVILGRQPAPVRVAGVGHGTDAADIGVRDLLKMPALAAAVRAAMEGAGTAPEDLRVIELDGLTLPDEALAMEALGFCPGGEGFHAYSASGRVNQSGGGEAGWCYPAMGLVRTVEAYRRLLDAPAAPGASRHAALAVGLGAVGGQTATAVVLEAK